MLLLITSDRVWSILVYILMHNFDTQLIPPVEAMNKLTLVTACYRVLNFKLFIVKEKKT